jgi:predicted glycosyltransferase
MDSLVTAPKKVLLHVECLQGVGEITQAASLASQLLKQGAEVSVVTSSGFDKFENFKSKLSDAEKARFSLQKLPPISLNNNSSELRQERTTQVLNYAKGAERIILASGWPHWLGEGILDDEMKALTGYAKQQNIPTTLLTREVMHGDSQPIEGGKDAIIQLFNDNPNLSWMVMGDAAMTTITTDFSKIKPRQIIHAGYGADTTRNSYSNAPNIRKATEKVVVTSGGGDLTHTQASFHLLHAAMLAAKAGTFENAEWTVIVGKDYPETMKNTLRQLADKIDNVKVVETLPYDAFQDALRGNTVLIGEMGVGVANDIIKNRTHAIIIPKCVDITTTLPDGKTHIAQFTEQKVRAKAFERQNLIKAIFPDEEGISINNKDLPEDSLNALSTAIADAANDVITLDTSSFATLQTNGFKAAATQILLGREISGSPSSEHIR